MPNCVFRFLNWLQEKLLVYSKDLSSFNLPLPVAVASISKTDAFLARERLAFNCEEEMDKARARLPLLNKNQRAFFESVVAALNDSEGERLFCLDAPGGTGKTFVLNCLMNAVRADGCIVIATALSAVASMLLEGGTTLHSRLKVATLFSIHSIQSLSSRFPSTSLATPSATSQMRAVLGNFCSLPPSSSSTKCQWGIAIYMRQLAG